MNDKYKNDNVPENISEGLLDFYILLVFILVFVVGVTIGISIVNANNLKRTELTQWEHYDNVYENCIKRELDIDFCVNLALKESGIDE